MFLESSYNGYSLYLTNMISNHLRLLCDRNPLYKSVLYDLSKESGYRIRDKYGFVEDADCPNEFKIIVADYISSYSRMGRLHLSLRDVMSVDECYNIADKILYEWGFNYLCYKDLEAYRSSRTIANNHHVWDETKTMHNLSCMRLRDLVGEKNKLEHNIWRIEDELRKGDKPHLDTPRIVRLNERKRMLEYINRIINKLDE